MDYYLGGWKKYAVFSGRARRKEYWMFVLFNIIVAIIVGTIGGIIHTTLLSFLYSVAVIIPALAVAVRRLHDTGRSGWWLLIVFIPVIGAIIVIIVDCLDSQPGDNQYGPNPKGVTPVSL